MHASTDTRKTVPPAARSVKRPDTVPWMAAWTGERVIGAELIVRPGKQVGIAYADELPMDRGERGALLNRGHRPAPKGKRGRPLFGAVNMSRQRRAMRKLLDHVGGGPADRNELGVLWLLDDLVDECEPGWPEEMITVHPPVSVESAAKAVEQCPELGQAGFTAVRVRDPQPYGYLGRLYAPDLARPHSPFPVVVEERKVLGFDDPLLPWLHAGQSAMCLVGCTVVDLGEELKAGGTK